MYAACDDLDHFASIQFDSVACLYVYGRFLESFRVAQNNPLVRFDLACRSDGRHSDNWPAPYTKVFLCISQSIYLWAKNYTHICSEEVKCKFEFLRRIHQLSGINHRP